MTAAGLLLLVALQLLVDAEAPASPDAGPPAAADGGADGATDGRAPPPARATPPGAPRGAVPPHRLEGTVLARGTREPLVGVTITVDGSPAAETDGSGRFALDLPPGRHRLQIQEAGYELFDTSVDVGAGRGAAAPIFRLMPRRTGERYETVVRAAAEEAPRRSLDGEELRKAPGSLGDPVRVVESLPGVAPVLWPAPVFVVRGANPGTTAFLLDGLRVPSLFHFALGPAVIHPYFIAQMHFYPGGSPARFGRSVAGAVSLETQTPPADRARASIDVRLYDAGGMVTTPFAGGRGTLALAGRYAYTAGVVSLAAPTLRVHYWDYQAQASYRLPVGTLRLLGFGAFDLFASSTPGEENDELRLLFHRLDARYVAAPLGGRLSLAVAGGIDSTRAPFKEGAVRMRARSLTPRLSFTRPFGRAVELEVGADAELQRFDPEIDARHDRVGDLGRRRTAISSAAYASSILRLGSHLVLAPGLRLDRFEEHGESRLAAAPRLNVRVRAADEVWLKASGGRATQMPSLPLQLPGFDGFGLATHGLQTSWQGSAGVEAPAGAGLTLDATVFVQRSVLTDIADPEQGDLLFDDFLKRRNARAYGLELLLRRPQTERLHGWISYTLSRSERAFDGGLVAPSDWDQRHVLNVVAGYRFRRPWTVGGRFHLHTGRPVVVSTRAGEPAAMRRLEPFYQFDVRAERRYTFDRFVLDLYVELVNATLNRQVTGYRYDGATRTVRPDAFRLVLPSIGLRAEI